jgi:hypothetical protein
MTYLQSPEGLPEVTPDPAQAALTQMFDKWMECLGEFGIDSAYDKRIQQEIGLIATNGLHIALHRPGRSIDLPDGTRRQDLGYMNVISARCEPDGVPHRLEVTSSVEPLVTAQRLGRLVRPSITPAKFIEKIVGASVDKSVKVSAHRTWRQLR